MQRFPKKQLPLTKSAFKITGLTLSSVAAVITGCQSAFAQLNNGLRIGNYGIPTGQELNLLYYQLSGRPLNQMQVIPRCDLGFGGGCNKSGTVLQQLVDSNRGQNFNNLLLRAAGGEENFRRFAAFYGNNPRLDQVPYSSFWRNDNPFILDSYKYVLGQPVGRNPVDGLGTVTRNFHWSPLTGNNNALSPRNGLLDFKYSYGRLLFEEVSKIPNLEQQIRSLNMPPDMTRFYIRNLNNGLQALRSGNDELLQQRILEVLSAPFPHNDGDFGRALAGIPADFNAVSGLGLPGEAFAGTAPGLLPPEAITPGLPTVAQGEILTPDRGGDRFPFGWLLGLIPLGLLIGLLAGGGGDDNSSDNQPPTEVAVVPTPTPTPPTETPVPTPTPTLTPPVSVPTPTPPVPTPTPTLTPPVSVPTPTPTPPVPTPTPTLTPPVPTPTPTPPVPTPTPTPPVPTPTPPVPTPTPTLTPPVPTPTPTPTPPVPTPTPPVPTPPVPTPPVPTPKPPTVRVPEPSATAGLLSLLVLIGLQRGYKRRFKNAK